MTRRLVMHSSIGGRASVDEQAEPDVRKRRPFKRRHNANKARWSDVYNLAEIRKLYGVVEQTVYNCNANGLKRVSGTSRFLVRGDELNRFHAANNAKVKRPLGPTQFYCLGCHVQREPAAGSVIGADPEAPTLRIEARCPICNTVMFRSWSKQTATALRNGSYNIGYEASDSGEASTLPATTPAKSPPPATDCDSMSPRNPPVSEKAPQMREGPPDT